MRVVPARTLSRRPIGLVLAAIAVVLGGWLLRDLTHSMSDGHVRHGVSTMAVVLESDGDEATVRIPTPDDDVVTRIDVDRAYAPGTAVAVVYDTVDPARASLRDAGTPSSSAARGLTVLAVLAAGIAGAWLLTWRRAGDDEPRAGEVRGGRVVEPASRPTIAAK